MGKNRQTESLHLNGTVYVSLIALSEQSVIYNLLEHVVTPSTLCSSLND